MTFGTPLRLLPLLAVLVLGGCASAHFNRSALTTQPVDSLPPVQPATLDTYDARYPDADAVFIRLHDTREHVFEPEEDRWDYVRDRLHQYVVLDPEEEWVSTLTFAVEDGSTLEGVFSRVTSPDGTVRTFGAQDFVRERDEDGGWEYRIAYPGIERGSLIEERFRTRQRSTDDNAPPLHEDIPLQRTFPIDSLHVRLVYPAGWGLQVKAIGQGVFPPYLVDRSTLPGNLLVQVDLTNVSPVPDEAYAPHFKEQGRYLEILVTGVQAAGVDYHAYETWEELGGEFARYAFRRGSLFGDPAARQAGRIIDASAPDSTRLAAIVTWVQENIEMGDGGDSFDEVLSARRGSPLFITGLTQAMLVSSGLDAEYLMIHPATEGYFDRAFVTGAQLPIPAVGVRVNGEFRVVFPYLRGLPVDYFPEEFGGGTALRVNADGFQGFVQLPRPAQAVSNVEDAYEIEIDEDGVLHVEEERVLRGGAAWSVRQSLGDVSLEEREELFRDLLTYSEGDVQDFTYSVEHELDSAQPLVIRLAYTIDHLVTVTPEEVIFQTGGLLSPAAMSAFEEDAAERRSPIRIYNDEVRRKRIALRYPEGWTLTTAPENIQERNRFGEVTGTYTAAPGLLTVDQEVLLRRVTAEASAYPSLLRLIGHESRLYVPTLVFEVRQ